MSALPLFYSSIAVLERDKDADRLVVDGHHDVSFAASAHLVPALAEELPAACREIPSAFVNTGEQIALVFIVGTGAGRSAFVTRAGRWDATHVPACLRRYPFILGEAGERSLVCIDGGYTSPADGSGERLFDETGANTPYLDRVIDFANRYARGAKVSDEFGVRLRALGLLKPVTIEIRPEGGGDAVLHGLMTVDEAKLAQLPDAEIVALHRAGHLAAIHCHLVSLGALPAVGDRVRRRREEAAAV